MTAVRVDVPSQPRPLNIAFSFGTLKHLGGQMYGGGIVKPVAELIANAWDADATTVEVKLPRQGAWDVEVADNGHGMTFDECAQRYLTIGTDRRAALGSDRSRSGLRKVMGRKGLGKLAVIQATEVVEVDTVAADQGVLWRTRFRIPYGEFLQESAIDAHDRRPVDVLYDGPAPEDAMYPGGSRTGTRTKLFNVRLQNQPNRVAFIDSMHTRFALAAQGDTFVVTVDGQRVPTVEEAIAALDFEFKWEGTEDVAGVGPVVWWVGFTRETQPRDELQGIGVYARGRLAVERPFFFNLTRGFTGQLAKEYMTGSVIVDAIDEAEDLIATDRGSVNWYHPLGAALEAWGQSLVRRHAALWEEARGRRRIQDLRPDERLMNLIAKLPDRPRRECEVVLQSLARLPHASKADLDRTATVLLNGQQHREFLDTLSELTSSNVDELPGLLAKWNVLEALLFLPVVRSRIEVIEKLERLIDETAAEFPDIFNHLKETPELLRPEWEPLAWNQWMSTVVKNVFDEDLRDDPDAAKRPDVLCLSDSRNFVVVELKRPGHKVSDAEARRMLKYMRLIQDRIDHNDDYRGSNLSGLMICDDMDADARYALANRVTLMDWRSFLQQARRSHRFILDRITLRVPADDPRVSPYLEDPIVRAASDSALFTP